MLGSNRNLIVTIGLVALVATIIAIATWPTEPTLQRYSYDRPDAKEYNAGGSQCEPAALASIRDQVVRLRTADACREKAEEDRHDRNDLVQQTRAADAAAAQAIAANEGLWMGWFQTIGGFITLAAAIAAAIYARDAAKHTEQANVIAKSAHRAWMAPSGVNKAFLTNCTINDVPVDKSYGFTVDWLNSGGSPAVSVATAISYRICPNGSAFPPLSVRLPVWEELTAIVAPGQSIRTHMAALTGPEAVLFRAGKVFVAMKSRAYYADVHSAPAKIEDLHFTDNAFTIRHNGGVDDFGGAEGESITVNTVGRCIAT